MTFWASVSRTYSQSWRFIAALPLIACAVVGFEGLQHVVEWHSGMYVSMHAAREAVGDPGRLTAGSLKVVWLVVIQYWVARYVASGGDAAKTLSPDRTAFNKFFWVIVYFLAIALPSILAPLFFPMLGGAGKAVSLTVAGFELIDIPLGVALSPWIIGAAIGDPRASPVFAVKRAWGSIWWGLGLSIVTTLPLMIIHYAFGLGAIGKAPALSIGILLADVFVVGFLGVVINVSTVVVAERMARRASVVLAIAGHDKRP